jgi:hypothetical protein
VKIRYPPATMRMTAIAIKIIENLLFIVKHLKKSKKNRLIK